MGLTRFGKVLLIGALATVASASTQTYRAKAGFYGPRNQILFAKPTFRWEIWSDEGLPVTSTEMSVNGAAVDAKYNPKIRALEYTMSKGLPPGKHRVECRVTIDRRAVFRQAWETEVVAGALEEFPPPNKEQIEALEVANEYRRTLGLVDFRPEPCLSAASLRHSQYLAMNREGGHLQKRGLPGFFGETSGDRVTAFGWTESSWEGVTHGEENVRRAVVNLFDAPYHRLPFMQPGVVAFGSGRVQDKTTLEFGGTKEKGLVVSPADGQRFVPRLWDGIERPDPLRIHEFAEQPVGYPIVFAYFDHETKGLSEVKTSLTLDDKPVPSYVNTPQNDNELTNAVFIMPIKPLKPLTLYKVSVSAKNGAGAPLQKSWSFTTGTN